MNWSLGAAFVMGLVSSLHCVGMCGGMVMAVGGAMDSGSADAPQSRWPSHLAYHAGRLITYTSLGVAAGVGGHLLGRLSGGGGMPIAAMIFSIAILAGVALHLVGIGQTSDPARTGWFSEIMGRILRQVSGVPGAFILGVLTGYLPCGVLYGAFALAIASASPFWGGAVMVMFWAGTTPLLLVVGHSGRFLVRRLRGNTVLVASLLILSVSISLMALKIASYNLTVKSRPAATSPMQLPGHLHSH